MNLFLCNIAMASHKIKSEIIMKSPELFLTLIEAKLCLLKIGTRSMDPQIKVAMAGHGRRLEQIIGAK